MECPVCFDIYKNPVLLPGCGHTLCQSCAEQLVTEGNFLRCPECRLVYQLRKGVKSLPRNVALIRTIEEHASSPSKSHIRCAEHPDDDVSLYCKTCEKSICLKCYFSNTLRRGQTMHTGHDVDTSDDTFSKEKFLLEEKCKECEERRQTESQYIAELEQTQEKLKILLDEKLAALEMNKNEAISQVKKTSAKLRFTLKGTVAKDSEYLQMSLNGAKERLIAMENDVIDAAHILSQAQKNEHFDINSLKESRHRLEALPDASDSERPPADTFLKVEKFNTGLDSCLRDPKKALSYQTESPRVPSIAEEDCIVSDTCVYITVRFNETVRVNAMNLFYNQAIFKGMSEKEWSSIAITDISQGEGRIVLRGLELGTLYRIYAVASNDFGNSPPSNELRFRTTTDKILKMIT